MVEKRGTDTIELISLEYNKQNVDTFVLVLERNEPGTEEPPPHTHTHLFFPLLNESNPSHSADSMNVQD